MPRKASVDLDLDASKYMSEAGKVAVTTKLVDEEMKGLGKETDAVGRDMDELALAAAAAKKELGGVGTKATETKTEMQTLQARIDATKASIRDMNVEWAKTGDDTARTKIRKQTSLLRDLEKAAKDVAAATAAATTAATDFSLASLLPGVGGSGSNSNFSLSSLMPKNLVKLGSVSAGGAMDIGSMGIPALVAAVAAATPMIGAMISGAIVGGIGVGGIAGGIFAASKDPRVKAAWAEFTGGLSAEDFGAGAFAVPTVKAIGILKASLNDLNLSKVLGQGAAGVPILAQGISDLVKNAMPGFNSIMSHATEIANIFGVGLSDIGDSLGSAMTDLMNTKGTLEGLQSIFILTADAIRITGHAIGDLAGAWDGLLRVGGPLADVLEKVFGWMPILGTGLREVKKMSDETTTSGGQLVHVMIEQGFQAYAAAHAVEDLAQELRNMDEVMTTIIDKNLSFDQAIVQMEQGFRDFGKTVHENSGHWTDNTAAAETNQAALYAQIGVLEQLREKQIAATGDVKSANAEYDQQVVDLLHIAAAAGASKAFLDQVAGTYEIKIIGTVIFNAAVGAANFAADAINSIFHHKAKGGPVNAYEPVVVGDGGVPELFVPQQDGYILPSVPPAQPAGTGSWQSASSMGSSALPPVNLTVNLVDPITGAVTRKMMITDALNRNQPNDLVAAAYP